MCRGPGRSRWCDRTVSAVRACRPRRTRRPSDPEEHRERHHPDRRRQRRRLTPPCAAGERQRHQLPRGVHRPPLRHSRSQEFIDSGTLWVDIECWGDLGANVSSSISKGDPVIVLGANPTHSWESESGKRSAPRSRRSPSGPTSRGGSAEFKRSRPARPAEPADGPSRAPSRSRRTTRSPSVPTSSIPGRDYGARSEALDTRTPTTLAWSPRTSSCPGLGGSEGEPRGGAGDRPAPPPLARRRKAPKPSGSVHLHHGPCPQGARRQGDPRQRHPVVPARRQDRRRRPERRRQVDGPEDHGRMERPPTARPSSSPGYSVGMLQQEPRSNESSTCAATSRRR